MRIHIGHHFFGAGNLGDDLMLAGFLGHIEQRRRMVKLSCAIPTARHAGQQRRFPQIAWLPYDPTTRLRSIAACDVWLGLGGSPFQSDGGVRQLDHLVEEAALCRRFRKPMYFLCVGINNRESLETDQARRLLDQAEAIWSRDEYSGRLLAACADPDKIHVAGDLAHLYFRAHQPTAALQSGVGWVLHFEQAESFAPAAFESLLQAQAGPHHWLLQESRPLLYSEATLLETLSHSARARLLVGGADYEAAQLSELLDAWPAVECMVTSRYHAAVVAAWRGARLAMVLRNDKLTGGAHELGVQVTAPALDNTATAKRLIAEARPIDRARLLGLADKAEQACDAFFAQAAPTTSVWQRWYARWRRWPTLTPALPSAPAVR